MPQTPNTDRYAVFGQPINHSKSPRIHSLFAQQTEQSIEYSKQEVGPEQFAQAVKSFFAQGGRGLNCTVPLKELAYEQSDQLTQRALQAKAVNTLSALEDGQILGDNTDGIGLVNDLTHNLGIKLNQQRILILGAGGAARGILAPLLAHQPERLYIANRTQPKAQILEQEFSSLGPIQASDFASLNGQSFDLIINATSASLSDQLPPLPNNLLRENGSCYDLAYANQDTPFVHWGKAQNALNSVDGLGMLVEQAAEAFFVWRKIKPDTHLVIDLLNKERG